MRQRVLKSLILTWLCCGAAAVDAGELVDLETPRVIAEALLEPGASGDLCWRMAEIGIRLKRPARVTVRVDGQPVLSGVDGGSTFEEGTERVLTPGPHRIALDWTDLSSKVSGPGVRVPFALDVRDARDPTRAETVSGVLETDFSNPPALTVGRTLVSGVDLFDGHVVTVANDHDELGGESALPITRTYTSAGRGHVGGPGRRLVVRVGQDPDGASALRARRGAPGRWRRAGLPSRAGRAALTA